MSRASNLWKLAVLWLFCLLFATPCSAEAAGLTKTSATAKAGAPVFLELTGGSGKKLEWNVTAGQMIYRLSKQSGDEYSDTRTWNGKKYTIYDQTTTGYAMTSTGTTAKIAVAAAKNCKVTVRDTGSGKTYSCAVTVIPQTIKKADVLSVFRVGMPGNDYDFRLSYAFAYANGNRAAFNGTIKVTIKNDDKTTVFNKTYTIAQKNPEDGAFYYDAKGAICMIFLNESGKAIKEGAKSTGTATIVAKPAGSAALKAVTVNLKGLPKKSDATNVTLAKTAKVTVGFTKTLKPKIVVSGEKLTGITWSSSNKKIATVTGKGVVKGIKAGTCNITCKLSNGKTYTCKVTVRANKWNSGKTVSNCFVSDYRYGYVSLELNSIYYQGGKLYTKWVAVNNRIFRAVKYNYVDLEFKDDDGKTFANARFTNVSLNMGAKTKKYVTLVFPASKVRKTKVDLVTEDFSWKYDVSNTYS